MPIDLDQTLKELKEIFGESMSRLNSFQQEQVSRLMEKVHEIAREAVKDDLTRLQKELDEVRARLTALESERHPASS